MSAQPQGLSVAEFLTWEASQPERHEYAEGHILAFAGGSLRHAALAANVIAQITPRLANGPCRVFGSDALIATADSARYADVAVTCDERDLADLSQTALRYPKVIVEVLSDSTAAVDRGEKLDEYRSIETLEEYVLIDSRRRWAESYRRANSMWIASMPLAAGSLALPSIEAAIDLDAAYSIAGL